MAELKPSLLLAKKTPYNFVLVARGANTTLLLSRKTIPAKQVQEAKTRTEGGKVYHGVLRVRDGDYVFQMEGKAPASLGNVVRSCIKRDAGLAVSVVVLAG
jgi:hypothetical protein